MASVLTQNNILDLLESISVRHPSLNSFFVGKDWNFTQDDQQKLPALQVYFGDPVMPEGSGPNGSGTYPVIIHPLHINVVTWQKDDYSNLRYVKSDAVQVIQDIVNEISTNPFYVRSNAALTGDINFTELEEFTQENLAGYSCTIAFRLLNHNSPCGLPQSDPDGLDFAGVNINGAYNYSAIYLTCENITGCTNFQEYVTAAIAAAGQASVTLPPTMIAYGSALSAVTYSSGFTLQNGQLEINPNSTLFQSSFAVGDVRIGVSADTGLVTIENKKEDGFAGFIAGEQNDKLVELIKFGQNDPYNFPNTSIPRADTSLLQSGSAFHLPLHMGASVFTTQVGFNPDNLGSRLDVQGFRIGTVRTLHIANTIPFEVSGTSNFNGQILSAGTDLYQIFQTTADGNDITRVQPGYNIYTGGTPNAPTLNISAATLSYLSAITISAGTFYSGNTPLGTIITNIANSVGQGDYTRVQNGVNTYTGGTDNAPTVNIVNSPSFNSITASGASSFTTLTATTFYSGGTSLGTIISNVAADAGDKTRVQPGNQITTGGTPNAPTVNVTTTPSFSTVNVSGNLSAGTFYSGASTLQSIIENVAAFEDTRVQPGSNITTGGTNQFPIVSVVSSPSFNSITASGSSSFQTLSATTFFSGNTNLGTIIANVAAAAGDMTRVQPGNFTFTAGTANAPTVNLAANISGLTVSASTFYSGSTPLGTIIMNVGASSSTRVQPGTNTYTGGTELLPTINVSAATINYLNVSGNSVTNLVSAATIVMLNSGSTTLNIVDHSQNLINTGVSFSNIIGGSGNTINRDLRNVQVIGGNNISGTTNDHVYMSNLVVTGTSAGNIFATNYLSGSTPLETVISRFDTRVQAGSNIQTGGTPNAPTVSVISNPIFNIVSAITFSGQNVNAVNITGSTLSAQTVSSNFYYSAGTPLETIISTVGATTIRNGFNTYVTGSTGSQGVNISAATLVSLSATTVRGNTLQSDTLANVSAQFAMPNAAGTLILQYFATDSWILYSGTTAGYLENTANWTINGIYSPVNSADTIINTYRGQKHYNTNYLFLAVADNYWRRLSFV